jgi:hypothetical protein
VELHEHRVPSIAALSEASDRLCALEPSILHVHFTAEEQPLGIITHDDASHGAQAEAMHFLSKFSSTVVAAIFTSGDSATEKYAASALQHLDFTIGTCKSFPEREAALFLSTFYSQFAAGAGVSRAFHAGQVTMVTKACDETRVRAFDRSLIHDALANGGEGGGNDEWFYAREDGQPHGPFSCNGLTQLFIGRSISSATFVYSGCRGMVWVAYRRCV